MTAVQIVFCILLFSTKPGIHQWLLSVNYKPKFMTESSCCFKRCNSNSGQRFFIMACLKFWADYCILVYIYCHELMTWNWSSWQLITAIRDKKVMSDTLWVTLIRLWPQSLSHYLQTVVVEISLQFDRFSCFQITPFVMYKHWITD
jgi:hypothetical protein